MQNDSKRSGMTGLVWGLFAAFSALPMAVHAGLERDASVAVSGTVSYRDSAGATQTVTDNRTRYFHIYDPDVIVSGSGLFAKKKPVSQVRSALPAVIVLHGRSLSADEMVWSESAWAEWMDIADEEAAAGGGLIVVYLNGINPANNSPSGNDQAWNDCQVNRAASGFGDDVAFFRAVVQMLTSSRSVDAHRIYAVGASNGGQMTYRLGFEASDALAGIGAVIANLPAPEADILPANPAGVQNYDRQLFHGECTPPPAARQLPVMIANGAEDEFMPYALDPDATLATDPSHPSELELVNGDLWNDQDRQIVPAIGSTDYGKPHRYCRIYEQDRSGCVLSSRQTLRYWLKQSGVSFTDATVVDSYAVSVAAEQQVTASGRYGANDGENADGDRDYAYDAGSTADWKQYKWAGTGTEVERVKYIAATTAGHLEPSIDHGSPNVEFIFGNQNRDVEITRKLWRFLKVHRLP